MTTIDKNIGQNVSPDLAQRLLQARQELWSLLATDTVQNAFYPYSQDIARAVRDREPEHLRPSMRVGAEEPPSPLWGPRRDAVDALANIDHDNNAERSLLMAHRAIERINQILVIARMAAYRNATADTDALIDAGRAAGMSDRYIAREMGIGNATVSRRPRTGDAATSDGPSAG